MQDAVLNFYVDDIAESVLEEICKGTILDVCSGATPYGVQLFDFSLEFNPCSYESTWSVVGYPLCNEERPTYAQAKQMESALVLGFRSRGYWAN